MCTIALLPHTGKPQALQIARCLIPRLQGLDVLVCTDPATAA
jgi:hypothetical protein